MLQNIKKFYQSEEDFQQIHLNLKQTQCQYCKLTGYLILHGFLYGYDEEVYNKRKIRGHRVFCSNRNKRSGCGKTTCILKTNILKRFSITAIKLWFFMKNISSGMNKLQSFNQLNLNYSNTTIYRLFNTFKSRQSWIRTYLVNISPTPVLKQEHDPVAQTIFHLRSAFNRYLSPIAGFQELLQISFL